MVLEQNTRLNIVCSTGDRQQMVPGYSITRR